MIDQEGWRATGVVIMTPQQVGRGERVRRAAERLAAYRLRQWCRDNGCRMVSAQTIMWTNAEPFRSARVGVSASVTNAEPPENR